MSPIAAKALDIEKSSSMDYLKILKTKEEYNQFIV